MLMRPQTNLKLSRLLTHIAGVVGCINAISGIMLDDLGSLMLGVALLFLTYLRHKEGL